MLNLPLFTVGCLNKRVQKLESSIMTHNPEVFEMEQQDLLWKRIGEEECSGLTVYTLMWFGLKYKKNKKNVYLFFLFRLWLKIAGFRKGWLFRYTARLAMIGPKEISSFVFSVWSREKTIQQVVLKEFIILLAICFIAVQCSNQMPLQSS